MFKPTFMRMSALSKRTKKVKIQVLKDFPMFNLVKGEVTQVKPSFMRNYLHNFNGARYVMNEGDIDQSLLQESLTRGIEMREKKKSASNVTVISPVSKKNVKQEAAQPVAKPEAEKPKPKGILEREITIKDVKIPGLDV